MARSTCRFCGIVDDISKLVEVCECHKKSDSALCHKTCLESYIDQRKQSDRDSVSATANLCPHCKQEFRVKVKWRWSTARYWSSTSISQYLNMGMILLAALSFVYAVGHTLRSEEVTARNERGIIIAMIVSIVVMTAFVVWTLYKRWKRHNMNAEVVEIV